MKRILITVDEDLIYKFELYCASMGMKKSSRIALLIEKDLRGKNV